MALTSIDNVYLDKTEYSRYEPGRDTVNVRVMLSGVAAGTETINIKLYREGGWLISTKTVDLSAQEYASGITTSFGLRTSDLMLEIESDSDILNTTNNHYWGRNGRYYIVADETVSGFTATSAEFYIMPVTTAMLRSTTLFGMTLKAAEVLGPINQPALLTGCTIKDVSDFMAKGPHNLVYNFTNKTIALDTSAVGGGVGTPVPIVAGQRDYFVVDTTIVSGEEYMRLDVDYFALPAGDVTEQIIVDNQQMTDETLRYYLEMAYSDIWMDLNIPLEPTIFTTDPQSDAEYHQLVDPVAFQQREAGTYMSIKLPHRQLRHLYWLKGMFNDGEVIEIPPSWRISYSKTGLLEFVPRNATMIGYVSTGLGLWALSLKRIPAFWHFRAIFGLPTLENKHSIVREAIYKRAGIAIMIKAGSAYRAGFASETVSRDGITASMAYTSSAMYGVYSADIEAYKHWQDDQWKRYKRKLRGISAVIL